METRASHLLVGSFVLLLFAGIAVFALWIARADLERAVDVYEIAFTGSVSGLQQGSQVRYRGIPVGRVVDIRIDPYDLEQVLVRVELSEHTPIKEDTVANLEPQGITGIVNVQLTGGTRASPDLEPAPDQRYARIQSTPSAIEQVIEFTPALLANAVSLIERALEVMSDENVGALGEAARHLEEFTGVLAAERDSIARALQESARAITSVREVSDDVALLVGDLRGLTASLDATLVASGDDIAAGLSELGEAASAFASAGRRVDSLIAGTEEPWRDFTEGGLYEFAQLIAETRILVASFTRISTEFERDPAGFFIGGQRGFRPE